MSRDGEALADMLQAGRLALEFKGDLTREEFLSTREKQSAIILQLLFLGEAAKRLSPEFRAAHPAIPFKEAAGMRDRIIHGYDKIDLEVVWNALIISVPDLIRDIEPMVAESRE